MAIADVFGRRATSAPMTTASGAPARRFEPVAQRAHPRVIGDAGHRSRGRRGEPGDARQVFGAGAAAALLAAAAQQRRELDIAGDDQRADAGRAADLVRRQGDEIGADLGDVERRSCRRACTASQWKSAPCACAIAAISATGWITPVSLLASITETSAGRGSPASSALERGEIDDAVAVDRDPLGVGHRLQHRTVLDRRDQDALAAAAEQRQMVGLGAAAGEDDAVGRRRRPAPPPPRAPARPLARGAAPAMHRRRIAAARQRRRHRRRHLGAQRRGRVPVEIGFAPARHRRLIAPRGRGRRCGAAGAEHALFADIAERHRAQIEVDLVAQLLPQIVGQTAAAVAAAADRRAGRAADRADRLVDREDDVGDARLVAVMRQADSRRPARARS